MSKVVVAMSGGVDSSVAAALLQKQGNEVTGIMLRLWTEPGREKDNRCCTPDSMAAARRTAALLDIPFYVLDAKKVFQSSVVRCFLEGYSRGITPNPCLVCNRVVRWGFLFDHAMSMGAQFMATGHYVRRRVVAGGKRFQLLRAQDRLKDQSYVLHVLNQEQLGHSLFPLGEYSKDEVRELATEFDLPSAVRPESQDLCFLAGEDYRGFLLRHAPQAFRPGNITDLKGKVLARHEGAVNYTIGQRKGIRISSNGPLYVLKKDLVSNTIVVGERDGLEQHVLHVEDMNWISGKPPAKPFRAGVKIRYSAREIPARVTPMQAGSCQVELDEPQHDVSAGQAAVFYDGNVVLGGGIINH